MKAEIIKQAYGEHWKTIKDYVDENGWCNVEKAKFLFSLMEMESKTMMIVVNKLDQFIRPKSIQGIETNNGWIKIESEADLPKIDFHTQYWLTDGKSTWIETIKLNHKIGREKVTHYQTIIKPQPPIY